MLQQFFTVVTASNGQPGWDVLTYKARDATHAIAKLLADEPEREGSAFYVFHGKPLDYILPEARRLAREAGQN